MFSDDPIQMSWIRRRLFGVSFGALLLSACASPLDMDHYQGQVTGEIRSGGQAYPTAWDLKIARTGLFSIDAGHAHRWEVTPSTAVIDLAEGHAVWLNILKADVDLENGRSMYFGTALENTVEGMPTAFRPFYVWFDNIRRPTLIRLPDKGCAIDFPVERCSMTMNLRVSNKHQQQKNEHSLFVDSVSYPFSDELRVRVLPEARDDVFISSHYFVCRDQSWRTLDTLAKRISDSGPLKAVALTSDEYSQLFVRCVLPRGPNFSLIFEGNSAWSVVAEPNTTKTYYNIGVTPVVLPERQLGINPRPLYDYAPYYKLLRLPSGYVDVSSIPRRTRMAVEDRRNGTLYIVDYPELASLDRLYFEWTSHHLELARDAR